MKSKIRKPTRRKFIKLSAGMAGSFLVSGFGAGCSIVSRKGVVTRDNKQSAPDGRKNYTVFSEKQIGSIKVKNRLIRSATMVARAENGKPGKDYIDFYSELAEGGVGLIITGFVLPTKDDVLYPAQIHIYDDSHIKGLTKLTKAVHSADSRCKIFAQVGHSGTNVGPTSTKWPFPWKRNVSALSTQKVDSIVTDFSEAVRRARESGFDGVELHGAHAYLLSSFLSPYTNKRKDKYGGSLQNRVRIINEIMDQSRQKVGKDFPIIIKLNSADKIGSYYPCPGGITVKTFPALAKAIEKTGVDAIDVSGNNSIQPDIDSIDEEAYFLVGAEALEVKIPVIVTGGNRNVEYMERILKKGEIDFFGLSRTLIREPDLPGRWFEGKGGDSADCIHCNGCFNLVMKGQSSYCIQV